MFLANNTENERLSAASEKDNFTMLKEEMIELCLKFKDRL